MPEDPTELNILSSIFQIEQNTLRLKKVKFTKELMT